nr:MAG TPA: hypothetical protein [Caudoviricetes sp.]
MRQGVTCSAENRCFVGSSVFFMLEPTFSVFS